MTSNEEIVEKVLVRVNARMKREIKAICKWAKNGEPIDYGMIRALRRKRARELYELYCRLEDRDYEKNRSLV